VTDLIRASLRQMLVASYDDLVAKLTRRVGSADLARDALQDTWLRLEQGRGVIGEVRNPASYLFQIALNVARDRRRADSRPASAEAIEAIMDIPDEAPGPAEIAEARSELAALDRALAELPERRRAIFLAAWGDGLSHREIAERHGLTVRMIDIELAQAREHCARRLKNFAKEANKRFHLRHRESSRG
jgi:RNA polymerase sigma factor (sigma-70 family)